MADRLRTRKLDSLRQTGAIAVAAGNIGCISQLDEDALPVRHTVQFIDWAVAARHRSEVTLAEIEEVIAFVIGDDKGWKIFHFDPPYSFPFKFRIFQNLDFFDRFQRQLGGNAANTAKIEATIRRTAVAHLTRPVALGKHHH